MSRPIEFRAWDVIDSKMRNVATIELHGARKRVAMLGGTMRYGDNAVLMQFTGLLDKNGTKIFEGDIVYSGRKPHGYASEVKWDYAIDDSSDYPNNRIDVGFSIFLGEDDDPNTDEVIGNIYENPDLLEK
jgi:uncharacterized phage protein (TIGR01671 family)